MADNGKNKLINRAHYLLGCRFDNWIRLLFQNRFRICPNKLPMALLITVTSALTFPIALAEKLIFDRRIKKSAPKKDPLFVIGHWRSGTTYLQNILSRDPQFGWCDPVSTTTFSISRLLRKPLTRIERSALKTARPMDNMEYKVDLPIEDTFALATVSPDSIIHMIAFPLNYKKYIPGAFVSDLSPRRQEKWKKTYSYIINKLTLHYNGKQLLLKSPDNTAHMTQLLELYPNAAFVNIHRDPYTTVMSTIHMFKKQMDIIRLSPYPPGDLDVILEDAIVGIFRRMYTELFELEERLGKNIITVSYAELSKNPTECVRRIYAGLGLDGLDRALPLITAYVDSQKGYVKNRFTISPRLRDKINSELGFYFTHYGYEMETEN